MKLVLNENEVKQAIISWINEKYAVSEKDLKMLFEKVGHYEDYEMIFFRSRN